MTRRGFTLIELVVSLSIVAVLSMALGSSILISTRALPNAGGGPETKAAAGRTLQVLGTDIRLATSVEIPNTRTLTLTLRDQTGDATAETVTYAWGGASGDPLTRSFNADVVTMVPSVGALQFSEVTRSSVTTDDRVTTPSDRVRVSFTAGVADPTSVMAEFRLLNTRLP